MCTGCWMKRSLFRGDKFLILIAAFVFAAAMYITVTIPAIRTVVTPVEGVDTREDQIEALRVLSAGNTLIMVLLGGVLALQVREPDGILLCGEWSTDQTMPSLPPYFFFRGSSRAPGGAGVGAEIGNEGSGKNCGRGSEGKGRCEEGPVNGTRLRNDIYSYFPLTFVGPSLMAIVTLLNWCSVNGIRIHPNLRLVHDEKKGICVRAANYPIMSDQSRKRFPLPLLYTLARNSLLLSDN